MYWRNGGRTALIEHLFNFWTKIRPYANTPIVVGKAQFIQTATGRIREMIKMVGQLDE